MTTTMDPQAPNTGGATLNPLPPPPVQAEHTGPVSAGPTQGGAASEQLLPSGTTGQQAEAAQAAQESGAAQTAAQVAGTTAAVATGQGASSATAQATAQGVNPVLSQTIAMAIALGLAPTPTSAAGWTQLADLYSTTMGENQVTLAEQANPTAKAPANAPNVPPTATSGATGGSMGAFLGAIRHHESGGNYQANSGDGAYGAYQFIPSTWNSEASAAGYGQYANGRADLAPPQVQDAVANFMATGYYKAYGGDFNMMARAWYDPAYVNQPNFAPPGNNGLTIGAYGQDIVNLMGQQGAPAAPGAGQSSPHAFAATASTNSVVGLAQSQLGVPYQWGGEAQGQAFDCSGLVQWAYGKEGVQLPRVAQAQYDATPKVAGGPQNLQPGDLLFFGSGPSGVEHVGIYIGNGQMIDAPHTGADVRVDTVFSPSGQPTWGNYVGATRPGDPSAASTPTLGSAAQQGLKQSQDQYGQILQNVTAQLSQLNAMYPGMFDTTQAVMP